MSLPARFAALLVALVVPLVAACGDGGGEQTPPGSGKARTERSGDGGKALGGNAKVTTLARARIDSLAPDTAAWVAWRVELQPGEEVEHRHAFSTVYAEEGPHRLALGSETRAIKRGGGAIVTEGRTHTHRAGDEPSIFWDVLLAEPGTALPGASGAERIFETEPLEGIPQEPQVAFLDVVLPPGGKTTVHTHPGPETIYVTSGPFEYQNGIEGSTTVQEGALKSIPPDTSVQKRNPGKGTPRFLSWFIVDPSKEFAPQTTFESSSR